MKFLNIEKLNICIEDLPKIVDGEFYVEEGEVVLLTGPNGCGKSTIIRLIMGDVFDYTNLDFSQSIITYKETHEISSSEKEREEFRKHVCYVSQDDSFESDSVLDCFLMSIEYYVKNNKIQYILDFIKKFDIQECFGIGECRNDRKLSRVIRKLHITERQSRMQTVMAEKKTSCMTCRKKFLKGWEPEALLNHKIYMLHLTQ